jgi:hypothetical protein
MRIQSAAAEQPPPTGSSARWHDDAAQPTATLEGDPMRTTGDEPIVNAILEVRPGIWHASEGELDRRVLVMKPARRRRRCCGEALSVVVEVSHPTHPSFTWGLWRCGRCERTYSLGPRLPAGWTAALARVCVELYRDYVTAVAATYGQRT